MLSVLFHGILINIKRASLFLVLKVFAQQLNLADFGFMFLKRALPQHKRALCFLPIRVSIAWGIKMFRMAITCIAFLAGCATHEISEISQPINEAATQRIFVATQRTPDQQRNLFGTVRPRKMNYGYVDVSIPPTHIAGKIEWPGKRPNPKKDFAVTKVEPFKNAAEFQSKVAQESDDDTGVTVLFVHGFNTTIPEATFRMAQIMHDYEQGSPAVLFGWPSAGDRRAYIYDRDSTLFARDDLVEVISDLAQKSDRGIALLAHSMGAHLVMEAMRQLSLTGQRRVLDRIVWVSLVAPDIDPDVFRRQAEIIEELPEEFYVILAKQDQAMRLAKFLVGGRTRVGGLRSAKQLAGLDVTVLDLSDLANGRKGDHGVAFNSPQAIKALADLDAYDAPLDGAPEFFHLGQFESGVSR